jgi:hypothetical protein
MQLAHIVGSFVVASIVLTATAAHAEDKKPKEPKKEARMAEEDEPAKTSVEASSSIRRRENRLEKRSPAAPNRPSSTRARRSSFDPRVGFLRRRGCASRVRHRDEGRPVVRRVPRRRHALLSFCEVQRATAELRAHREFVARLRVWPVVGAPLSAFGFLAVFS